MVWYESLIASSTPKGNIGAIPMLKGWTGEKEEQKRVTKEGTNENSLKLIYSK